MKQIYQLMAAATVVAAMTSCSGKDDSQQGQQVPEAATMVISLSTSEVDNTYPVSIKGLNDVEIRPQVSGFITKVKVDEGDKVKAGQVLFVLDQVQYEAAVNSARAAVNSAQTAVNTAKSTEQKDKALLEKGIISNYAYELTANQLRTAEANLASARAQLTNARKNLDYTVVKAPISGVVGQISFREGALASPSTVLTTVSDNSKVYADFSLSENYLLEMTDNGARSIDAALKELPKVQLVLANGAEYALEGEVVTIEGSINAQTGAAKARALFDNPSRVLRSGATGRLVIPEVTEQAILIPQNATFGIQDRRFVLKVDDQGHVSATPVTTQSGRTDSRNYVVTSGLKAGDRIVVEGVNQTVRDGMTVKPVDAKQAADQAQNARPEE